MKQGVENEKKSNDCEFNEDDVTEMVDFMTEQVGNMVKCLCGKEKQCRFSPITAQFACATWSKSPSQF